MDTSLISAALWFGIGALSYKIISYLMGYAKLALLAHQTVLGLLYMLRFYNRAFEEDKEKFINLENEKGERKDTDALWDLTLEVWRTSSVRMIRNSLPAKMRGIARFNTWKEAMRYLEKHEKHLMDTEGR